MIKIDQPQKINKLLADHNGRATEFTINDVGEVQRIAIEFRAKLAHFLRHKKNFIGARYVYTSGGSVASKRIVTLIVLEYRKAGIYLTHVQRTELWPNESGGGWLRLTEEQDLLAIKYFREQYRHD